MARSRSNEISPWGLRIALALYAVFGGYILGAALVSVIPQVFWPHRGSSSSAVDPSSCNDALAALRADLLASAARQVRSLGEPSREWLATWDHELFALHQRCAQHPSYSPLERLRYGLEEHLQRIDSDLAGLARDSERAIGDHP